MATTDSPLVAYARTVDELATLASRIPEPAASNLVDLLDGTLPRARFLRDQALIVIELIKAAQEPHLAEKMRPPLAPGLRGLAGDVQACRAELLRLASLYDGTSAAVTQARACLHRYFAATQRFLHALDAEQR